VSLRLLLVGHGRMGRQVEAVCGEFGMQVAGIVDRRSAEHPDAWPVADVAIDFSHAEAVPVNLPRLGARGLSIVLGTTGWQEQEARLRADADRFGIGVVAAPNFALGVNLFLALAERAGELLASHPGFGAWIHEHHHAAKRDAPSGTAVALGRALRSAGYAHRLDISSTRAGQVPGRHTLGFDAASETITLTHTARDRTGFARGALAAAAWVHGRRGWYGMKDVLGISQPTQHRSDDDAKIMDGMRNSARDAIHVARHG
jgi:4-hydroxy-tetrahydrodipicolinate reductase